MLDFMKKFLCSLVTLHQVLGYIECAIIVMIRNGENTMEVVVTLATASHVGVEPFVFGITMILADGISFISYGYMRRWYANIAPPFFGKEFVESLLYH
jgi:hypothetical protein